MGPHKNPELFNAVARPNIDRIKNEFLRRNTVAANLQELAEVFNLQNGEPRPIADPLLYAKLYGLSMTHQSAVGISGFTALESVDRNQGMIVAKAAPPHDSYTNDATNETYQTRVINLSLSEEQHGYGNLEKIKIFALNFYHPDPTIVEDEATSETGLLLIGKKKGIVNGTSPIIGDVSVFAAINTETNDAKIYKVTYVQEPNVVYTGDRERVSFEGESTAIIRLSQQVTVRVEQLTDELERQASEEFVSGTTALKLDNDTATLSVAEKAAIDSVNRASSDR
ncbi:MAG: hypothetical protein WAO28_02110 [Candidatus Microsaccharimonas sp.]